MWSPCSSGSPQKTDSFAFSTTSFETGTDSLRSFWSGPPWPKAQLPIQYAIQLSMIVVITSWAPTVAFRKPAIPAQAAPASAARAIATTMCSLPPRPAHEEPTQTDDHRADDVLALAADVEHAAAERERDREAGEHERRGDQQRLLQVVGRLRLDIVDVPGEPDRGVGERHAELVRADLEEPAQAGAVEDLLVGRQGVVAGRRDHDPADEEGEDGGQQGCDHPAGAVVRSRAARPRLGAEAQAWREV